MTKLAKLTLNRAAKEAQIAKSTLLDAIRNGRLSASKNDKGHYEIQPAELFRVFPKTVLNERIEPIPTPSENQENTPKTSALEAEVKVLRERLADKDDQISDLRRRLDGEAEERRHLTALLTAEKAPADKPGFWGRLFSGSK